MAETAKHLLLVEDEQSLRQAIAQAHLALARKFLGVIYHTLKNNWVFEDFPNCVLAS